MFTRFVECHVKPDKKDDFTNKLRSDVLPILQKQPGFVDLVGLVCRTIPSELSPSASGTASRMRSAIIVSTSTTFRKWSSHS